MADIINLRTVRKRASRAKAAARAQQNRRAHGRPKAERELEQARVRQAGLKLDAHRLERGEPE